MRYAFVLALFVLLAACSSDKDIGPDPARADGGPNPITGDPAKPGSTSGTRLKVRNLSGEDGSKQFVGFYDTALKVACTFQKAADGKQRCLPSGMFAGIYSKDNKCEAKLAGWPKGCTTPFSIVAQENLLDKCEGKGARVYSRGALYTGAVYVGQPGACVAATASATDDLYELGNPEPLTGYVAADEQNEP